MDSKNKQPLTSAQAMELEDRYGAQNYHPLPVVLSRGSRCFVWDCEGKRYFDFLAAYSAANQGHCHPKIVDALIEQAKVLTLVSRAFYTDRLGEFERYATEYFGYQRVLPMNTGVEAVETAIKLTRRWGYDRKKIPENQAKVIFCEGNFHGRTLGAISASNAESSRKGFGPFVPGFVHIPFNDIPALERALKDPHVAGFIVEPIQGEGGVVVPADGYLKAVRKLCTDANVLFVADEVQTGLGRAGRLLACQHEDVRPDMIILGKALGGGILPVSAVLADDDVMLVIRPGEHGSTFGGNALAAHVAMAALDVIRAEKLVEASERLGAIFRREMIRLRDKHKMIGEVRGRGLMNGVVINPREATQTKSGKRQTAWEVCLALKELGMLAKPTQEHVIRFTPPLVITEAELMEGIALVDQALTQVEAA